MPSSKELFTYKFIGLTDEGYKYDFYVRSELGYIDYKFCFMR